MLTFRGDKISDVVAFAVRAIDASERERYHRWVDEPLDAQRTAGTFARFGLPDQLR